MQTRQPWADVVAEPARPTAEQEEWLKAEGFREEPEEQPDEDAEDGPPKVTQQLRLPCKICSMMCMQCPDIIGKLHQGGLMLDDATANVQLTRSLRTILEAKGQPAMCPGVHPDSKLCVASLS